MRDLIMAHEPTAGTHLDTHARSVRRHLRIVHADNEGPPGSRRYHPQLPCSSPALHRSPQSPLNMGTTLRHPPKLQPTITKKQTRPLWTLIQEAVAACQQKCTSQIHPGHKTAPHTGRAGTQKTPQKAVSIMHSLLSCPRDGRGRWGAW